MPRAGKLNNFSWMITEKIVSIFGLIIITGYVARYIGANIYGELALSASTFQIIQLISQMGCDNLIIKRTAQNIPSGAHLVNAAMYIIIIIYCSLSIPALIFLIRGKDHICIVLSLAVCMAYFLLSLDLYNAFNSALLKSKTNTLSNLIGLFFSLIIRYFMVAEKMNPEWLGIPVITATLIPLTIRLYLFKKNTPSRNKIFFTRRLKNARRYGRYICQAGGAILLSTISVAIYTRTNQFVIAANAGTKALGIYSAALTLAMSWSFVTAALISTTMPSIYHEQDKLSAYKKSVRLNILIILMSFLFILLFIVFGRLSINIVYGYAFRDAYIPGVLICFGCLFSALGAAASRYIIKYNGFRYLSVKSFITCVLSFLLSFPLIKKYGITGAAAGMVATELISCTILNYFFKEGVIFKLHRDMLISARPVLLKLLSDWRSSIKPY
jgi:O-antigen/teichoic acid export membrane protein